MGYAGIDKTEHQIDQALAIFTTEIEEWAPDMLDYHRSEPTPYKALDLLFDHYQPFASAYLLDYGSGLGRINLYFHHRLDVPGLGLEIDPDRAMKARHNLTQYAAAKQLPVSAVDIAFVEAKAEDYELPGQVNTIYLFHPFSDWIFRQVVERIIESLNKRDRELDIILYYPSFGYFQTLEASGYFEEWLFVDCPWNKDPRDGFWVFRHLPNR